MRYSEIINETDDDRPVVIFDDAAMAKAEASGFDMDQIWYHGTKRKFNSFKMPAKKGIDELGRGIYLTSFMGTANVWAQGGGHLLACVVRKGPLVDLDKLPTSQLWSSSPEHDDRFANPVWRQAYHGHCAMMERNFGMPGEKAAMSYRDWAEDINRGKISVGECLSEAGYIGATKRYSQIKGQVVIWKPEDVCIVGRAPGYAGYLPD